MVIKELTELEFNDFISKYPFSSIYQTVEYSNIMISEGYSKMYIGGIENGELVAGSLLLIEKIKNYNYAYAPRGFLLDYTNNNLLAEFTKEMKKFLGKKDIIAVKLSPIIVKNLLNNKGQIIGTNPKFEETFNNLKALGYYHYGFNSYFEANKPRFEAMLDLSSHFSVLFKNIKREYKTKIRAAENKGIKIYRADINEIGHIYSQIKNKNKKNMSYIENSFKEFGREDKIDYYYAKLDTEIFLKVIKKKYEEQEQTVAYLNRSVLSKGESSNKMISRKIEADRQLASYKEQLIEATNLIREYPTGVVLSTIVVVKHKSEVTVYMDAYDKRFKSFSAKHLLLWKVIEKYSSLGFKRLNLGGVIDPRINDEKYNGLNQFKLNFNSTILEYLGDLEIVTHGTKYFLFKQLVKPKK